MRVVTSGFLPSPPIAIAVFAVMRNRARYSVAVSRGKSEWLFLTCEERHFARARSEPDKGGYLSRNQFSARRAVRMFLIQAAAM